MPLKDLSFGRLLLPREFHQSLAFDRYEVVKFVRQNLPPLLRGGLVLDAGSGATEEQYFRGMLDAARFHTFDIFVRSGLVYVADIERMPIREGSYDVALCTQVLEHVPHPPIAVNELYRVLKPGGHLILTTPQTAFLHEIPHHYFNHTCFGLRMMLEQAGFEVLKLEPQGGHFRSVGMQLHYTCTVVKSKMTTPLRKILLYPVLLACSLIFGFLTKLLFKWLDRFDHERKNTLGWNCLCRKPQ